MRYDLLLGWTSRLLADENLYCCELLADLLKLDIELLKVVTRSFETRCGTVEGCYPFF